MHLRSERLRGGGVRRALLLVGVALSCGGDKVTGPADAEPVASLTVSGAPTGATLVGSTLQLTAIPKDAAGNVLSNRSVTWRSSDATVASVDGDGVVRTLAIGRATVTAASEGKEGTASLDVRVGGTIGVDGGTLSVLGGAVTLAVPAGSLTQATIVTIAPATNAPPDQRLSGGSAYELGPDGVTLAQPASLTLMYDAARLPSGAPEISMQIYGLVGGVWTLVTGSSVNMTAKTVTGSIARLTTYAVMTTPVERVAVSGAPSSGRLYIGQTVRLQATMFDAADNVLLGRSVTWATSDATKATVSSAGIVTAVAPGPVTITATSEGKSASTTIEIALVPVSTVAVMPGSATIYAGQVQQLTASPADSTGRVLLGRTVTWASEHTAIATVDESGKVTGVATGTATIRATSEGKSGTATVRVLAAPIADWSQAAEWVTYQGNASRTGYVAATVNPAMFKELWVATVATGAALNPVTAGDGNVLVSTNAYFGKQLVAVLDAQTGAQRWSRDFGDIHGVHPPAYAAGTVYLTTSGHEDSFLWAFEAATGTVRFRSSYGNQWSRYYAPVVVDGNVYMAGGYYGGVYRFSATDGAQGWFVSTNQYDEWTPAVANGLVYTYTGSYSPKVSVLDAATGAVSFEIADPSFEWNGWSMNLAPVLGSSNNLIATNGGRLISFDLAARAIKWTQKASFTGTVTTAGGVLYVVNNGQIEARRESDGSLLWVWVPPAGRVTGPAIVTKNLLFVSTATTTYALDLEARASVWSYPAAGHLALSKQGILFIAQTNGKLAAISVK